MQLKINDQSWNLPDSWNDMSLKQVIGCYHILQMNLTGLFDSVEQVHYRKLEAFRLLTGLSKVFFKEWEIGHKLDDPEFGRDNFLDELYQVLKCVDFLFHISENDSGALIYKINPTFTRIPWSYLSTSGPVKANDKLFGPKDELENITFYELMHTFSVYESFVETGDEDLAHQLLSILFRPAKKPTDENKVSAYQGDIRLPYMDHEATTPSRVKRMATLPPIVKKVLVFWFASCRYQIIQAYPNIFSSTKSDLPGEKVGNDYGWSSVLFQLAGNIKDIAQVSNQNYSNVLTYLSYLEDQRKLEEIRRAGKK
jgi:hypothetical protein